MRMRLTPQRERERERAKSTGACVSSFAPDYRYSWGKCNFALARAFDFTAIPAISFPTAFYRAPPDGFSVSLPLYCLPPAAAENAKYPLRECVPAVASFFERYATAICAIAQLAGVSNATLGNAGKGRDECFEPTSRWGVYCAIVGNENWRRDGLHAWFQDWVVRMNCTIGAFEASFFV